MYIPKHYQNNDQKALKEFMESHPFGILVTQGKLVPLATHIPFMIKENEQGDLLLLSHISKANPQWELFNKESEVLVIFNGPQHYISSSWYQEEEVPTWDYVAVHAYGKIEVMDTDTLKKALNELVHKHEEKEKNPVDFSQMSAHTQAQYRGVVGFTVQVSRLEGAFKLSQTRPEDHSNIIRELEEKGTHEAKEIAQAIKQQQKKK